MDEAPFIVNLTDRKDVTARLRDARRILTNKERRLRELRDVEQEVREWRANVQFLESKAPRQGFPVNQSGPSSHASQSSKAGPSLNELVGEVVNREHRKISVAEIRDILSQEGHPVTSTSVRNALHYAARRAKRPTIRDTTERGVYAPLNYQDFADPRSANSDGSPAGPHQAQPEDAMAPRREGWPG